MKESIVILVIHIILDTVLAAYMVNCQYVLTDTCLIIKRLITKKTINYLNITGIECRNGKISLDIPFREQLWLMSEGEVVARISTHENEKVKELILEHIKYGGNHA